MFVSNLLESILQIYFTNMLNILYTKWYKLLFQNFILKIFTFKLLLYENLLSFGFTLVRSLYYNFQRSFYIFLIWWDYIQDVFEKLNIISYNYQLHSMKQVMQSFFVNVELN